jgi:predicted ATPase
VVGSGRGATVAARRSARRKTLRQLRLRGRLSTARHAGEGPEIPRFFAARLWRDQGKRDEARELLALVYGWFTEGFDTLDLKEAKALLEKLAS